MKKVAFNLNDYIHVRLTPLGIKHWENEIDALGLPESIRANVKIAEPDANGWRAFQMHDFMRTFGRRLGCGLTDTMNVMIEVEDSALTLANESAPVK